MMAFSETVMLVIAGVIFGLSAALLIASVVALLYGDILHGVVWIVTAGFGFITSVNLGRYSRGGNQ